jgi:hypothetical protein
MEGNILLTWTEQLSPRGFLLVDSRSLHLHPHTLHTQHIPGVYPYTTTRQQAAPKKVRTADSEGGKGPTAHSQGRRTPHQDQEQGQCRPPPWDSGVRVRRETFPYPRAFLLPPAHFDNFDSLAAQRAVNRAGFRDRTPQCGVISARAFASVTPPAPHPPSSHIHRQHANSA